MGNIFLSHSSNDNAVAEQVRDWLAERGHQSVFLDFDPDAGIPPGCSWERTLYRKLRACRAVVVICTDSFLASHWCFAELALARLEREPVIPLLVNPLENGRSLPDLLLSIQNIDLRDGRDGAFYRLSKALAEAGVEPTPTRDWRSSDAPYPGLEAFREQDAAVFFGRGGDVNRAMDILRTARREGLLLVLGASGCGKSSFVRAGVIPSLRRQEASWIIVGPFKPGIEPLEELASAVARAFAAGYEEVRDDLLRTGDLSQLVPGYRRQMPNSEATVVVVVDQLEESLQRPTDHQAATFLQLLRVAVESENSPLVVLATIRSDFLEGLQQEAVLRGMNFDSLSLSPLSIDGMREAIEEPARLAQVEFEAGLVEHLLRDVATSDALPLLAFTLRVLWERAHQRGGELRIKDYSELGGLHGAVAHVAERAAKKALRQSGEATLRRLFLRFARITEDGRLARQRLHWSQLSVGAREILTDFVDSRLLVSGGDGTVSVCHEAVFRGWNRYASWLTEHRQELMLIEQLERQGAQWSEASKAADYLWRGSRLASAKELMTALPGVLGDTAESFVRAGIELEWKSREHNELVAAYNKIRLSALETYVQRYLTARRGELAQEIAERESKKQFYFDALAEVLKNEPSVVDNELSGGGRWHPKEAKWVKCLGAMGDYVDGYEFPCCGLKVLGDSGSTTSETSEIPQRTGQVWTSGYGVPTQYRKDGCMEAP